MEPRQTLLDHITLQEQLQVADAFELWTGTDSDDGSRFTVSILSAGSGRADEIGGRVAAASALVHPALLRTVEHGFEGEALVLAASVPAGFGPLPDGQLSQERAWTLLSQIIDALDYAHALGFPHGRLGPASLLANRADEVRLVNHGLWVQPNLPPHASPQQEDAREPTVADDIYALGALAFEWLTGETWHPNGSFPQPSSISPTVQATVLAMLSAAPYDRPRKVAEIRALLSNELGNAVELAPISASAPIRQPAIQTNGAASEPVPAALVTTEGRTVSLGLALGMFAVLLAAVALVIFLPGESDAPPPAIVVRPAAPEPTPGAPQAPAAPTPAPMEVARLEALRNEANEAAQALLRVLVELEDAGALSWAHDDYDRITRESEEGDALFRDDDVAGALDVYTRLREEAATIYDTRFDVAERNKASGRAAFDAGDFEQAIRHLALAQQIDAGDAANADLLDRATGLEDVLNLLAGGNALEASGQLEDALFEYEKAQALDAQWPAATEAIARVSTAITDRNFAARMSEGFAAIERREFSAARAAFESARSVKPDSAEVQDGLSQAAFAERMVELNDLDATAREHAAAENWDAVRATYEAMLALDPSLVLATEGRESAIERQQLEADITRYLQSPLLLTAEAEYTQAKRLVGKASRLAAKGGRLSAQIIELSTQLTQARIPVNLEVRSDNLTELTVASVGALGRITSRELELYPGVYTIVGKRRGYKDVSARVTLLAGSDPEPVFVSCSEKI